MKKYLKQGSIKAWKAFLYFQILGWIAVVALLTLSSVALPKSGLIAVTALVAIPYALYAASVLWVNTGNPKTSIKSAFAKLWCVAYMIYAIAVCVRIVAIE